LSLFWSFHFFFPKQICFLFTFFFNSSTFSPPNLGSNDDLTETFHCQMINRCNLSGKRRQSFMLSISADREETFNTFFLSYRFFEISQIFFCCRCGLSESLNVCESTLFFSCVTCVKPLTRVPRERKTPLNWRNFLLSSSSTLVQIIVICGSLFHSMIWLLAARKH
jgi:hypothetical protein